tara:strand:+ start:1059 stop:1772 length:714 start_codon:yes stop_codon:yes gene_type:complete
MSQWPNLFGEGASRGERPAGHVWFKGEFRKADDPELRGWVQSMEDMENFEALYSVFRELLELEKGERMRTMVTNRLLVRERMQSDRKLQQEILLSRTEVPPVAPSGPVGLVEKLARGAGRAARAKADLSVKAYGSIRKAGLAAGGVGKNGDVAYEDRLEAACQRMFGETSDGDEDDEDDDDEEEEAREGPPSPVQLTAEQEEALRKASSMAIAEAANETRRRFAGGKVRGGGRVGRR